MATLSIRGHKRRQGSEVADNLSAATSHTRKELSKASIRDSSDIRRCTRRQKMMFHIFRGLTLSHVTVNGHTSDHVTPLNDMQQRILELLELPLASG
jgi:hypothetical protein